MPHKIQSRKALSQEVYKTETKTNRWCKSNQPAGHTANMHKRREGVGVGRKGNEQAEYMCKTSRYEEKTCKAFEVDDGIPSFLTVGDILEEPTMHATSAETKMVASVSMADEEERRLQPVRLLPTTSEPVCVTRISLFSAQGDFQSPKVIPTKKST